MPHHLRRKFGHKKLRNSLYLNLDNTLRTKRHSDSHKLLTQIHFLHDEGFTCKGVARTPSKYSSVSFFQNIPRRVDQDRFCVCLLCCFGNEFQCAFPPLLNAAALLRHCK